MKPEALRSVDPARFLDLDVRADLRNGREPFRRIMHAKDALADDGILRLRAVFEPEPLYAVLGREGFLHWTERLADDDWRVWFYREGVGARDAGRPVRIRPDDGGCGCGGGCGAPSGGPADVRTLDVRGLEPPEPMVRTLEALEELPRAHTLVQVNARVPRFLLPELEARGFRWEVLEESEDVVRMAIRHDDGAGDAAVVDVRLLAPRTRHPAVFRAFDALPVGGTLVLVADHDPAPLRAQLERERDGAAAWSVLESGPDRWRFRITRGA